MKDTLKKYTKEVHSFHMPGHKNGKLKLLEDPYELDVTEVPGTDDLYHQTGILQQAVEEIEKIYDAYKSYLLVNGSTVGILTAISACANLLYKEENIVKTSAEIQKQSITKVSTKAQKQSITKMSTKTQEQSVSKTSTKTQEQCISKKSCKIQEENKKTILINKNAHKSVYNGAMINQLEVKCIEPEVEPIYGFSLGVTKEAVKKAMEEHKNCKIVVITSPTYEGIIADIEKIADIVHEKGGMLIVDEAHGAHLNFAKEIPNSSLVLGADIVIQSCHKTLPALTQTGIMHVSNRHKQKVEDNLDEANEMIRLLNRYIRVYQTSSPSYVLMNSIYESTTYMETHQIEYEKLIMGIKDVHKEYKDILYQPSQLPHKWEYDPLKLIIKIEKEEEKYFNGVMLSKALREKKIQVELAGEKHLVAIVTIADKVEDVKELLETVRGCKKNLKEKQENLEKQKSLEKQENPEKKKQYYIEVCKEKKLNKVLKKSLYEAEGTYLVEDIIPYPPGSPILRRGQQLRAEDITKIHRLLKNEIEIYGIL